MKKRKYTGKKLIIWFGKSVQIWCLCSPIYPASAFPFGHLMHVTPRKTWKDVWKRKKSDLTLEDEASARQSFNLKLHEYDYSSNYFGNITLYFWPITLVFQIQTWLTINDIFILNGWRGTKAVVYSDAPIIQNLQCLRTWGWLDYKKLLNLDEPWQKWFTSKTVNWLEKQKAKMVAITHPGFLSKHA